MRPALTAKIKKGRLPTEAEWEKAGRGPVGYSYSFGANPDQSKGNFGRDFKAGAQIVNSFQPNGFGLYNMSGNVWEWVNDWFAFYAVAGLENQQNKELPMRKFFAVEAGIILRTM